MFGTFMTIIIIGYIGYYGYNIVHDLYFDKSGEVVAVAHVEEQEVDIKDELGSFTQYDADEDRKIADQKKKEAQAADVKAAEASWSAFSQKSVMPNPDAPVIMTGGIEADQLPNLVDSLENTEEGSDFFVIKSAFTPASM